MTSMAAMRSPPGSARSPSASSRKGTARRVLGFARPYRRDDLVFLLIVVLARVIGVATPVLAGDVVNAIARLEGTAGGIVRIALFIAGLAVVDARLSLAKRWYSSRIGEGIIFDLRTRVYDHVQRMPVAVLHPDPDRRAGQPAQQRRDRRAAGVHLDAVRRGLQRHRAGAHRRRDVHAVLADHRCCRWCWCRCSCCRPAGSAGGWRRSPASPTSSTRR